MPDLPLAVKRWLRGVGPVARVNAARRCHAMKRAYAAVSAHYADRAPQPGTAVTITETLPARRLSALFVGAFLEQDSSGIMQGLERVADVAYFHKEDGGYGMNRPIVSPSAAAFREVRRLNGRCLVEQVDRIQQGGGRIDVVLGEMWDHMIAVESLVEVRRRGIAVVNVAMDDQHAFSEAMLSPGVGGSRGLLPALTLAATAAPEAVAWYRAEGCPAIYLPEASDPSVFHPMDVAKDVDVSFVGRCYGIRPRLVRALVRAGLRVRAHGADWPDGMIASKDMPELFARSRIVLGVGGIGHCADFRMLKMRDFDAAMSGSFYLTTRYAPLNDLLAEGREIACYEDVEECVNKARHYVAHDDEREAIAAAGLARARAEHTWERRFTQLLATTMSLAERRPASPPS